MRMKGQFCGKIKSSFSKLDKTRYTYSLLIFIKYTLQKETRGLVEISTSLETGGRYSDNERRAVLRIWLIAFLTLVYSVFLLYENYSVINARKKLKHVIHVNGTRGKSSVTRLISAGLSAGGYKTFTKTTGTLPMTIDSKGSEKLIKRYAPSNIKEQVKILKLASKSKADVLVIECMALRPEYQYISQHKILDADIGVITNVRLDHTEIMGDSLNEIALTLSNTIPQKGLLITAEEEKFNRLSQQAGAKNSEIVLVKPENEEEIETIDFPENVSLALEVCRRLGIERITALEGMKNYKKDPFALEIYRLKTQSLFIAGLAINDYQSICNVYENLSKRLETENKKLILLINNRSDRVVRTAQMADVVVRLNPNEVWVVGSGSVVLKSNIKKKVGRSFPLVKKFKQVKELDFSNTNPNTIIYGIGNIGENGQKIMELINNEGEVCAL